MAPASPAPNTGPVQADLSALGGQLNTLLQTAAKQFISGNSSALKQLGSNFDNTLLKAIFNTTVLDQLPPIADLPPDADAATIAAAEATLDARDQQAAIIAVAEQQNAALVAQMKQSAMQILQSFLGGASGLIGKVLTDGVSAL